MTDTITDNCEAVNVDRAQIASLGEAVQRARAIFLRDNLRRIAGGEALTGETLRLIAAMAVEADEKEFGK